MDPDVNLFRQLDLARRIQEGHLEDATELAELVEALHDWITAGGFLPQCWQDQRKSNRGESS